MSEEFTRKSSSNSDESSSSSEEESCKVKQKATELNPIQLENASIKVPVKSKTRSIDHTGSHQYNLSSSNGFSSRKTTSPSSKSTPTNAKISHEKSTSSLVRHQKHLLFDDEGNIKEIPITQETTSSNNRTVTGSRRMRGWDQRVFSSNTVTERNPEWKMKSQQQLAPVRSQPKQAGKDYNRKRAPDVLENVSVILKAFPAPPKLKPIRDYTMYELLSEKNIPQIGDLLAFNMLDLVDRRPEVVLKEGVVKAYDTQTDIITIEIDEAFLPERKPSESTASSDNSDDDMEKDYQNTVFDNQIEFSNILEIKRSELSDIRVILRSESGNKNEQKPCSPQ